MKQKLLSILFIVFLCQYISAQLPDSLSKKVDSIFAEYDKTNSPGCALAILKDGKIIYERDYGMSNLEYNIAINPTSIFHIASISKQFTAAAIIRLSLEGKLSLNDDIRKYIPEVPDFGHTITLNNLIHHTSGIRDQWDLQGLAGWREGDLITEKDILEMLSRQKSLNFLPGEEYSYCNTGFTLAGIVVKKITGVSLRNYADSVFFKPLGMMSTHFHSDHSEITPNRTSAYYKDDNGKWKISIPVFDNYGATSLFTTVEDLAKWDENFYTNKIGGEAFIKAMLLTSDLNDKTPQNYASGLVLGTYKGYKTEGHSGADAGYRSNLIRFPEEHFSVIVFANLANINTSLLSFKVADLFLKDKSIPNPAIKVDSTILKVWAGEYFDGSTQTIIRLNYKNEKLLAGTNELVSLTNSVFKNRATTYTFSGDTLNTKVELNITGSKNQTFKKVKRIKLSFTELQEYQGDFYSPELETKYNISAKDSVLILKAHKIEETEISPFIKDIFEDGLVIRFSRNKKNIVDGFFLSTGRVRNLYFSKISNKLN
jgi:CubicO group peptidase (beta-lactamase class C family)